MFLCILAQILIFGSMLICAHRYYFNNNSPEDDNTNVTAFPPNFRMISGDTRQRNFTVPTLTPFIMGEPFNLTQQSNWGPGSNESSQLALSQLALGFNCLNYDVPPEASREYNYLRPKSYLDANCTDGIRLEVMFPSCWDGVNLDSPDHKSHVQFPSLVQEGSCNQTTHSHRIPALFYETIFDTYSFKNLSGSFVIANGDPTGFGYHGDFMSGWNQSFLQQAINVCNNKSGEEEDCPIFTIRDDFGENCTGMAPAPLQAEDVHGPMLTLPGDKIIQSGPGYADAPQATPLSIGLTGSLPPSSSANLDTAVSTSTCPNTSSTPLPSITQAPTISTAPANVFSTSTYTTNNLVVEVVIVESFVTVTETTTDLVKRHHGSHHLYHRHH